MRILGQTHPLIVVILVAVALSTLCGCDRPEVNSKIAADLEEPGIPKLPCKFTNLEVLPADITKEEMKQSMKLISRSIGVKCEYCHRTDTRDYATDEITEKRIARKMMHMVEQLNRDTFTWEDAPRVTCFMCHRGDVEPVLAPSAVPAAMPPHTPPTPASISPSRGSGDR
jgi:hypothetical protein